MISTLHNGGKLVLQSGQRSLTGRGARLGVVALQRGFVQLSLRCKVIITLLTQCARHRAVRFADVDVVARARVDDGGEARHAFDHSLID